MFLCGTVYRWNFGRDGVSSTYLQAIVDKVVLGKKLFQVDVFDDKIHVVALAVRLG